MTERSLSNGWCTAKTIRRFLFLVLMLNLTAWLSEATGYLNGLETAIGTVKYLRGAEDTSGVEVYDLLKGKHCVFGLACMVVATVVFGSLVVHRESFKESWYVTLRRIPDYRGKYLLAKLAAVLFPGILYVGYYVLQWLWRWRMYCKRVPEELRTGAAGEGWQLAPIKSIGEISLCALLFAMSVLLGNLVLRRIKKDIPGLIAALGGIVMTMLLFFEIIWFSDAWQLYAVLLTLNGMLALFLVRHVYQRL